ncbi:MAG: hypothetical protein OXG05_01535 [Gammaproteobacteria bacterium]|nr:hypothetical protein [Gammaproteobacteria bacterium]
MAKLQRGMVSLRLSPPKALFRSKVALNAINELNNTSERRLLQDMQYRHYRSVLQTRDSVFVRFTCSEIEY